MKRILMALLVCLITASGAAHAALIEVGTATGGLGIYYNNIDVSGAGGVPDGVVSGYDENPTNQAYVRMQLGYTYDVNHNVISTNTNGAAFQFDDADLGGGLSMNDIFSGAPVGQSQFGFDLQGTAATYNPGGGVLIPSVDFADNVDNSVANAILTNVIPGQGQGAWAINDYKEPSGPAAGGSIINSLLRGTSFTMNVANFQPVSATAYSIDVSGWLLSDGLFHWYNPAFGTTDITSWNLQDSLYYEGTLTYDLNYAAQGLDYGWNTYGNGYENGADQFDFYQGEITIFAAPVPEPTSMTLLGLGLVGLAVRRYRKRA